MGKPRRKGVEVPIDMLAEKMTLEHARQLKDLAAKLKHIAESVRASTPINKVAPVMRECMHLIEWVAPHLVPEAGGELADMQLMLAMWQRVLQEVQTNRAAQTLFAFQANKWSYQVLDYSGLLNA
jgi:hypothetical protein